MRTISTLQLAAIFLGGVLVAATSGAQEFEQAPIHYSQSQPDNCVSQLVGQVEAGQKKLSFEENFGYLRSLLAELNVPVSSQTLVFSKTSLQRHRIAPSTPRALYFNDDVYVGYCQDGDVLEISAVDPELGTVYYTLNQDGQFSPRFRRQTDNCLICHGSSQTKDIPGHVVRSLFTDASGLPLLAAGSVRVDQTTPLAKRWGGWYVTGTHGEQTHRGNLIVRGTRDPEGCDNSDGQNQTCLTERFDTSKYLTGHSDIVALMVLEHQTDMHNYITRANFLTRQALHYQESLNRDLKEPEGHMWDSVKSRIKNAAEPLVEYLFFSGETQLTSPIHGTSGFAKEFPESGKRDARGRSLRDLDLETRLFKYPCSYLVYSSAFAALPAEVKEQVFGRMHEVLDGSDKSSKFAHLSPADRKAIGEILNETLPEWQSFTASRKH
jgi:hypothetical protein